MNTVTKNWLALVAFATWCSIVCTPAFAFQTEEVLEKERRDTSRFFEDAHDALSEALDMFDEKGELKESKDIAFYDLAEAMKNNIYEEDKQSATEDELSEKGYINSFNHIAAQAIMTTLFDEKLADYVADTHERKNMPELITGDFTKEQIDDIKFGVVDNYVDIVNNEWGQELGKFLKSKYAIDRSTLWTPELMSKYLNDIQSYFGRVFQIRLNPFTAQDHVSKQFSKKLNHIMDDVSGMW